VPDLNDGGEIEIVQQRSLFLRPFLSSAILQYVDYLQTWVLVSRYGIGVEGNPLARLTWNTPWGWIIKLLIIPAILIIVEFHPWFQSYKDRGIYGTLILALSVIAVGVGFYYILIKIVFQ
jgi:Domain of unknown function (DUF5658)